MSNYGRSGPFNAPSSNYDSRNFGGNDAFRPSRPGGPFGGEGRGGGDRDRGPGGGRSDPQTSGPDLEYKSINASKSEIGNPRALHFNQRGDKLAYVSDSALRIYNPEIATSSVSSSLSDPTEKTYQPSSGYKFVDACWNPLQPAVIYTVQAPSSSSRSGGSSQSQHPPILSQIDTRTHKPSEAKLRGGNIKAPFSVSAHPSKPLVAVHLDADADIIQLYDVRGAKPTPLQEYKSRLRIPEGSVKWTPDGALAFAIGDNVQFLSEPDLAPSAPFRCHKEVRRVAVDRANRTIATAGMDGAITFWDAPTMAASSVVFRYNFPVLSLALSPDGLTAAACIDDGGATRSNPTREEVVALGGENSWWADHLTQLEQKSLPGPFLEVFNTQTGEKIRGLKLCTPFGAVGNSREFCSQHSVKASVADHLEFHPSGRLLAFTLHGPSSTIKPFGRADKDIGLLSLAS